MALVKTQANSAFTPVARKPGLTFNEKYYISYEIKTTFKKVGEGEEDYVPVKKKVIHKEDIRALINSQAKDVGVYNLIERVIKTGDPTLINAARIDENSPICDITKAPQSLAEGLNIKKNQEATYAALPDSLKKGRTLQQFVEGITAEEFNAWVNAITPKKTEKKVEKKEEVK